MKTLVFSCLLVSCVSAVGAADDVVNIPLDTVWAHEMPGTRDIGELEKGVLASDKQRSLLDQLGDALGFVPQGQTAGKGFAVVGTEKDALRHANAVLTKKQSPRQSFPANSTLSIVFFSHSFNQFVHLDHVERHDKTIKVTYRLVPHATKQLTAHFALIPLGKIPAGKYSVDIVRLPLEEKYVNQGFRSVDSQWDKRIACQPFTFEVVE